MKIIYDVKIGLISKLINEIYDYFSKEYYYSRSIYKNDYVTLEKINGPYRNYNNLRYILLLTPKTKHHILDEIMTNEEYIDYITENKKFICQQIK